METFSAGIWRSVDSSWTDATLIANRGPQTRLIWWLPLTAGRVLMRLVRRRADFVLVGDALTYAVLQPLLSVTRTPHATLVMGLDITWNNKPYRAVAHRALRRAPLVLAISSATARTAVSVAGVDQSRVEVLRLGLPMPPDGTTKNAARAAIHRWLGLSDDTLVLLTVGRLVRRKGARWFIENVLLKLPDGVLYVIAGEGPERVAIERAADRNGLGARVRLLGRVSDEERELLFRGSDIFLQPNVPVENDLEGFGLVTIEAAMRDTLTLASELEGICDAVVNGQTGILLPPQEPDVWVARLRQLLGDRPGVLSLGRRYGAQARALYGESTMANSLRELIGTGSSTLVRANAPTARS
jgi:glycosyltransferase involved in cell wall biosynthesis